MERACEQGDDVGGSIVGILNSVGGERSDTCMDMSTSFRTS